MNVLFNCSKTWNAVIVFYETINFRILKPREEVGMDVVIADCTKQCAIELSYLTADFREWLELWTVEALSAGVWHDWKKPYKTKLSSLKCNSYAGMEERHTENTTCVLGLQWDSSGCSVDRQADLVTRRLPCFKWGLCPTKWNWVR